jgi:hypothetical protein
MMAFGSVCGFGVSAFGSGLCVQALRHQLGVGAVGSPLSCRKSYPQRWLHGLQLAIGRSNIKLHNISTLTFVGCWGCDGVDQKFCSHPYFWVS